MAFTDAAHLPSVLRASGVLALKSIKHWEIPGTFLDTRVHSSWAHLTACCWVTYRELVAVTGSYVVPLFRNWLQYEFT